MFDRVLNAALEKKKATMITTISLTGTNFHENLVLQVKFFYEIITFVEKDIRDCVG